MPGEGTHIVPTPNVDSDMNMYVSELIDYENGCWNIIVSCHIPVHGLMTEDTGSR